MTEPGPIPVSVYLLIEPTFTRWSGPRRVAGARVLGVRQRNPGSVTGLAVVKVTLRIDPAVFEPLTADVLVTVDQARSVPALAEHPGAGTDPAGC
jgi:hypothetical protein